MNVFCIVLSPVNIFDYLIIIARLIIKITVREIITTLKIKAWKNIMTFQTNSILPDCHIRVFSSFSVADGNDAVGPKKRCQYCSMHIN